MFSTFLKRKALGQKRFSLNVCEAFAKRGRCKLQAPIKGGEFWRETHTPVTSHWTYHSKINIVRDSDSTYHFFHVWKTSFAPLKARTHLRMKIYDIAFWWVFLSMIHDFQNSPRYWKRVKDTADDVMWHQLVYSAFAFDSSHCFAFVTDCNKGLEK